MNDRVNFDLADRRAEEEREAAISAASRAVKAKGKLECEDCSAEIPAARRAVYPSARRCIRCQSEHEADIRSHR
ncbi:TraR/DksA C4-type zinc finger protein [Rhizobium mayense]|uniref:TraR/DksA C4-type zinc finger protein n=1 Tax=Rhizobium mayense TaxID=1312184 RepID=A0ABT7K282_9HYPH|nr:TraR/DksA C4-type zinc finger protein [Rhizobium mayense]MDL2401269.1 TraR/DksA C4-type zinc finger protein [Rhizobium mayense]